MNLSSPKKHQWIILLGIFLIVGIAAGGYFLYLQPLDDKLDRKQTELDMANQQLTILENKAAQTSEQTAVSTMKLQKLIPVKRHLEQLILDIEKAEVISNVLIEEISMNGTDADELLEAEQQSEQDDSSEEENLDETNQGEENTESTPEEPVEIVEVALPEGVNRTSITIKGSAENYFEVESFIESLLSLKRIVVIDNLTFKGQEEIREEAQKKEPTEFSLAFSAYYYPKLVDLLNELPPIDAPEAANKKNPLISFPNSAK